MPALVATGYNADMKTKYQALVAAGKPAKVAITAVMRKIVILANALLKANRPWAKTSLDHNGNFNLFLPLTRDAPPLCGCCR